MLRLGVSTQPFREVIGVVRDAKYHQLNEEHRPFAFLPSGQFSWEGSGTALLIRALNPQSLVEPVRREFLALDPALPLMGVQPIAQYLRERLAPRQTGMRLLSLIGGLALALAAAGVYGVMAYAASQRTREVGIRVALGAQDRHIRRLFLRDASRLALLGIAIGTALALVATRAIATVLVGVAPTDVITFAVVILLLILVALLAGYLPAWRAARIDPAHALRS